MLAFLKVFLIIVEIICSLLLIGVILLQKSKGEGLGMAFGSEMGESLFGARATNVLVKITVWLGVIFMLNTVFLARIYSQSQDSSIMKHLTKPAPVPAVRVEPSSPVQPEPIPVQPAAISDEVIVSEGEESAVNQDQGISLPQEDISTAHTSESLE